MPKQQIEHILTPETEKHFFTDQILQTLLKKESATIIWPPHGGMKTQMSFLAQNTSYFGFDKLGNFKMILVNHLENPDNSPQGYFSLMLRGLKRQVTSKTNNLNTFWCLKNEVIKNLQEGTTLIFIFLNFDLFDFPTDFYNQLVFLWQIEKSKVLFLFCSATDLTSWDKIIKFDQLKEVIGQNKIYFPLLPIPDTKVVIKRLVAKYRYKITPKQETEIHEIGGGYIGLIKELLRLSNNNNGSLIDKAIDNFGVNLVLENLWNSLDEKEKMIMLQIAKKKVADKIRVPETIEKLKIVQPKGPHFSFFSPLFPHFIQKQKEVTTRLTLDKTTGEILLNGLPIKGKITLHEYYLFCAFLENPNKILSRDDIAEVLWGKYADEKYSDWAIDQAISLLRKKMEKMGLSARLLQTIKGRGYRWLP
jgi:DNA-binding winged helix-turn-helix (wHTH) protein